MTESYFLGNIAAPCHKQDAAPVPHIWKATGKVVTQRCPLIFLHPRSWPRSFTRMAWSNSRVAVWICYKQMASNPPHTLARFCYKGCPIIGAETVDANYAALISNNKRLIKVQITVPWLKFLILYKNPDWRFVLSTSRSYSTLLYTELVASIDRSTIPDINTWYTHPLVNKNT